MPTNLPPLPTAIQTTLQPPSLPSLPEEAKAPTRPGWLATGYLPAYLPTHSVTYHISNPSSPKTNKEPCNVPHGYHFPYCYYCTPTYKTFQGSFSFGTHDTLPYITLQILPSTHHIHAHVHTYTHSSNGRMEGKKIKRKGILGCWPPDLVRC